MKTTMISNANAAAETAKASPVAGLKPSSTFDKDKTALVKPAGKAAAGAPENGAPGQGARRENGLPAVKTVPNLERTLKLVEELHRRKVQRERLISTIDSLESFELGQLDDAEEAGDNPYQSCLLAIEDDKRRQFVTKNPVIIKAVAGFIRGLCSRRLGEIESEIVIPA